ncbi:bifunctional oligoribonuclease/PAP phosphatase NrnA [Haloplanus rubicundus]|uniref:Bifunctional oligoribonuclease/PAP phosphatase NrnA n=1 Tax=Haloplanus rubicundus TaxID=1547898 RepID=A0A345E424_9EURY|nr:bifunctional oligoribonuclease/PAP phosphatase NrnA [Haloplanus rubicundus]AXG06946.1 bifunctional oligoribonuclease/PAP phosphatase NrnA [Haloplanus rubicundus]
MSRARTLYDLLADADALTVVCHNNPDPDCLSSALALGRIAAAAGVDERRILYSGQISHQQNRAFVNLLNVDLQPFDPAAIRNRPEGSLLAFVDHAVPGANNEVPADTPVDVVIDHHPAEGIEARFVDHREAVGATATILTEYVVELDVEVDSTLATALAFAIRRETLGFLRGATVAEYEAVIDLYDRTDLDLLRRLSTPSVSGATVDTIADAVHNRVVRGSTLVTGVGHTSERDALPQAADYLATLEGVQTAVVFGIVDDSVQLSARSTDSRVHVGNALSAAFDDVGSAGGHREMGGGEIPLGIFAGYDLDDETFLDIVERVVTRRLSAALGLDDEESGD